jgi:hypothetical protein
MNEFLSLEKIQVELDFSAEQYQEVEDLSAINYTVKDIAMYFNVKVMLLQREFDNVNSLFKFHFDRGRLIANAKVEMKNRKNAEEGNTTAIQIFKKNFKESKLIQLKQELFGI